MTEVILLTAAVKPNVDIVVALVDPVQRAEAYKSSLKKWSKFAIERGFRLAMVETSGAAQSVVWSPELVCDYLSYQAPDASLSRGKGAAESSAIDSAVRRLDLEASDTLYKCTGRLWLRNAAAVVASASPGFLRLRRTVDWTWVDTRLMCMEVGVWASLFSGMEFEVDDRAGCYMEHVVASRALVGLGRGQVGIERFSERPIFIGSSGSTGASYSGLSMATRRALLRPVEALLAGVLARRCI